MTDFFVMYSFYMKNVAPLDSLSRMTCGLRRFPVCCQSALVCMPVLGIALLLALW